MIRSRTVISAFVAATAVLAACGGAAGEREPVGPHGPPTRPVTAPATGSEHRHAKGHGHHHRFEDAASWSAVFDDPARDAWQKPAQVLQIVNVSPGMTVADVGAGTGYFSVHLARAVGPEGRVLAVDVEPDMVRWLGDRARRERLEQIEAIRAAPDDPRLPAGKVDRVIRDLEEGGLTASVVDGGLPFQFVVQGRTR
jgi:SAM-dependent methyltransferase